MIIPIFDVSGVTGASGTSGTSRGHSRASGGDGLGGGHGTGGRCGTSAGTIAVRLTTPTTTANIPKNVVLPNPIDADVKLDASIVHTAGQLKKMDTILKIDSGGSMSFFTLGGHGGNGGNGGNGQHGGHGYDGRDATSYSDGTDGGRGGNGGNGGNAGKGGDGGSGGTIRISALKADTHLFVLCGTTKYSCGRGGSAGTPGIRGTGGSGGKGGSSYTYSYKVGEETYWKTNPGGHDGPSGWDGIDGKRALPGRDGQDGAVHFVVHDGETHLKYDRIFNLNLLKFKLVPVKQDGIIEPGCRVLVSSIKIRNDGGMPTPTTRNVLAYIKPDDCGPAMLHRPSWVVSEGYDRFVSLPPGLEPDVTTVVQCATFNRTPDGSIAPEINAAGEYLAFCVAPVDPVLALSTLPDRHLRGEVFKVTASLTIRAQMTPFGRDFDAFINPMPFPITYPVKMSPVACLPSLLPGGNTLVKFSVSNVALRGYGEDSKIGRVVIVKATYTGGDLGASKVQFVPIVDGNPTSPIALNQLTQVLWPIPHLSAGETCNLSGRLSLLEDAEPYTTADFSVDLLLGEICNPSNAIRIQRRQISVCTSTVYKKTPNSGTLLVVNPQTTKEELKAWEELARFIFGENNPAGVVDVWDISQEGDFDLNAVLMSGSTLIEDWRSCTIVVLDNPFDNFRTRTANERQDDSALQYVNPDQLTEAALSNGTHFCIVSSLLEKSAAQDQHLVTPQRGIDFTSSMAFETVRHLLDPFAIEPTSFVVYGNSKDFVAAEVNVRVDNTPMPKGFWSTKHQPPIHQTDSNPPQAYTRVERIILVQRAKPFKSLKKVVKLAASLRKELLRKHPERRYTLSVCHSREIGHVLLQACCQIPPKMQAAIRVRRLLDVLSLSSRITLTAAPASPVDKMALSPNAATIHTPAFIKSPQVTSAFVQSIPYACRLALYVEALCTLDLSPSMNDEQRAGVLRASLLADLACEQEVLRLKKRNHGLTEACFKLLMPRLSAFCQIDLPAMPLESAGRHHLLALLTDLKAYMASKFSWYQGIFPGYRSSRVTKVSNNLIDGFMSRIFSSKSSAKKHIAAASSKTLKEWKKDLKSTKKSLSRSGNPNQLVVTLKGRALAAILGSVAWGENKWSDDPNNPVSVAGSVCTEFGMLFTPESFTACRNPASFGHPTTAEAASGSGLGSITHNRDSTVVTNSSIIRKATITSRSTLNKRLASDFTSSLHSD
ncbi:hypothetical protein BYT27DRAFT_7206095 [Phlegmacium glaucopus]|nr:hypothetical protein BYT27DRAFT_7206095 [Phlegmacium glaucopus]